MLDLIGAEPELEIAAIDSTTGIASVPEMAPPAKIDPPSFWLSSNCSTSTMCGAQRRAADTQSMHAFIWCLRPA